MAATLANGGVNPVTGERALDASNVDEVLSVMTTCGMYDYAGEWLYRVGMPAKSGVAGGVLAVLPGQFGIGVFSPPLDARGNSVRGVAVCEALSSELELHSLRASRAAISPLRARLDLRRVRSKRIRGEDEEVALADAAHQAAIYQLQGDLSFAAMERVVRKLQAELAWLRVLVLDLEAVSDVSEPAGRMLRELLVDAARAGLALGFVGLTRCARLARSLGEAVAAGSSRTFRSTPISTPRSSGARRACWARALRATDAELVLEAHPALRGLDAEDARRVAALAERRELSPRQVVVREGEAAEELFLLVAGRMSVFAAKPSGELHRLATLLPGASFGESALLERGTRTALVRADEPSVCWALRRDALEAASAERPRLMRALLGSLLRSSIAISARLTRELAAARSAPPHAEI